MSQISTNRKGVKKELQKVKRKQQQEKKTKKVKRLKGSIKVQLM